MSWARTRFPESSSLSDDELAVLVRFVRALVEYDEAVLWQAGAYDHGGDPYTFTRDWRLWDHVDLIMPPGEPRTWHMDVYRDGSSLPAAIVFDMFTVQEGRSDLTLEVHLVASADGNPLVRFGGLHVMQSSDIREHSPTTGCCSSTSFTEFRRNQTSSDSRRQYGGSTPPGATCRNMTSV